MKTKLVVIQPTPFCNLNCRYCYLPQRSLNRQMSTQTLVRIFQALFSSSFMGDRLSCVWHAGEPLVLSIDFYQRAFQIQQQLNTKGVMVKNAFQTNATLINQEWCDFFLEHDVQLSISIDGPAYIHDVQRVDRKNRGTFEHVMRGIELLRANKIRYSAIAVITSDTVDHPEEFMRFFMEVQPTQLGLNPEEVIGSNEHSSLHTTIGIEKYKHFLQRLLTLDIQDHPYLPIRDFERLLRRFQSGQRHMHTDMNTPMSILNFDYEGNISTFSSELLSFTHPTYGSFTFGNVFDTPLDGILTHKKFIAMNESIQRGVAKCQESCEYFFLCGGGAPAYKLHENNSFDSAETNACRLQIKVTADVLLEHLEERYSIAAPTVD
jgi:uncharacterized protein